MRLVFVNTEDAVQEQTQWLETALPEVQRSVDLLSALSRQQLSTLPSPDKAESTHLEHGGRELRGISTCFTGSESL